MSDYSGKKVLLVNIASGSPMVSQLAALRQLQSQYADSLVVLAFPSNSFGNEPLSDEQVRSFCISQYQVNFPLAQKGPVAGATIQPVYSWLAHAADNGDGDFEIQRDFQKILIGRSGRVRGIFSPRLSPMDTLITNAIEAPEE
jgi:glutathione peroxidase